MSDMKCDWEYQEIIDTIVTQSAGNSQDRVSGKRSEWCLMLLSGVASL